MSSRRSWMYQLRVDRRAGKKLLRPIKVWAIHTNEASVFVRLRSQGDMIDVGRIGFDPDPQVA